MILGIDKLHQLVREKKLVENLCQRELNNPEGAGFDLRLGEVYRIKGRSFERINTPHNILVLFRPRTTIFRSGMMIFTGNVSPGYCGELNFGIVNLSPVEVEIELGARVVHAIFYKIEGKTSLYRGQWQGGRVTTKQREKQI